MEKVIIKSAHRKYALLLLGSFAFVTAGVVMLVKEGWYGWVPIVFFGTAAAVSVWQLVDPRPRLVFDERGVVDRTLGVGRIEWLDIKAARVMSINDNDFICLELRDLEKYLSRLSKVRRALAKANRVIGFTDLSLNLSGVSADTDEVFALVRKFRERARREAARESDV